jgi:polyphenol oxidase
LLDQLNWELLRLENNNVYRAEKLDHLSWLDHGFGTRLSSEWPDHAQLATLRQIHSDQVLVADHVGVIGEGDALISAQPGLTLAIRTADCLPVLIADRRNKTVAAVHAGWRGIVREVAPKTVEAMARQFGSRPEDLTAILGPAIGACCFEVGPEVAIQFARFFPERQDLSARTKIDLAQAVVRQLRRIGVPEGHIGASQLCTYCQSGFFHSYRRDGDAAGRMISAIRIREAQLDTGP